MNVRACDLPKDLFQTLKKLQHVTIIGMYYGWAPFADMAMLPELKSFKTERVHESMTQLAKLQELHITGVCVFHLFDESFSNMSQLTKLQVGSKFGTNKNDIVSLHAFSGLHTLTLNGPFKHIRPGYNPGRLQRWDALTTLTSVQHLCLLDVDHVYDTFAVLGEMTQLTALYFCSINPNLHYQKLDEGLLGLSSLTNLKTLTCKFQCSAFQLKQQKHQPMLSAVGDLLKYSLSFCSSQCACEFGCRCKWPQIGLTDGCTWCHTHRRYNARFDKN